MKVKISSARKKSVMILKCNRYHHAPAPKGLVSNPYQYKVVNNKNNKNKKKEGERKVIIVVKK